MSSVLIPMTTVTINPSIVLGVVDPKIYGQFLEHVEPHERIIYGGVFDPLSELSDEIGIRRDVVASLGEMGVPVIRWPGGIFADSYHWKDGVGERTARPCRDNRWGGLESNQFGTDEYLALCRLLRSTPYICLNAGTGTPEEAEEWVQYCKRYWTTDILWGIGNEMYGQWEPGHCSAEEYAERFLEFAHGIRCADPNGKLVAVGAPISRWNDILLSRVSSKMDYLSIHMYAHSDGSGESDYWNVVGAPVAFEQAIRTIIEQIGRHGLEGKIRIAVDEWNVRHMNEGKIDRKEPRNLQDALFAAGVFNVFQRLSKYVGMANYVFMVNGHAPLLVNSNAVLKTTLYHIFSVYQHNCHPYAVMAAIDPSPTRVATVNDIGGWGYQGERAIPILDASATTDGNGHMTISIINRAGERVRVRIEIPGVSVDKAILWTLSGDSPAAANVWDEGEVVNPRLMALSDSREVVLEPWSVNLLMLDTANTGNPRFQNTIE